ncbi:MAG: hypothetical protein BWX73_00308 [Lentisphaerae bacterium ADurb.Bin082]|nr:MAG: hypothetical protein BWX73_00308 [Lentisphaerae bacterium ADurb.Bin082]HQL86527.1 AAA family ATPase [Lentisphaeria bacterium]
MIDAKLIPPGILKHDPATAHHILNITPPRSLLDIRREVEAAGPDPGELIKNRFICKGSVGLFTAETGMGKSSLILQAAMLWGLGRRAFGMEPTKPLRILIIQAENDKYDLNEESAGVEWGLVNKKLLTAAEVDKVLSQVQVVSDRSNYGDAFIQVLSATLEQANPKIDLVFIDPLFAFAGCDLKDQGAITHFLRGQINPLVERHNVALVLVHHKTKSSKNAATNGDYNQSYDFHGSAELANFPRFSLVLDRYQDIEDEFFFTLRAPKRGSRLAWQDKEVYLRWSKEAIFWEELSERPATAAGTYSSNPAMRRQQKETEDNERLDEQVKAAVGLLKPGQAVSVTEFRGLLNGSGLARNNDRQKTIIETCVYRKLLTKRAPDKNRGEGGRGVSVMIERPATVLETEAGELFPK